MKKFAIKDVKTGEFSTSEVLLDMGPITEAYLYEKYADAVENLDFDNTNERVVEIEFTFTEIG